MKYLKEWGAGAGETATAAPADTRKKLNENRLASILNARDSRAGNHLCG